MPRPACAMDGQQADRRTGNLVWYGVEHAETRPGG